MDKLAMNDVLPLDEYEKIRPGTMREIIDYKRLRRLQLGPFISLTFENRKTMKFQVQEMLRAEKLIQEEAIQKELDVYNSLLPDERELSATLFIEITEDSLIMETLRKFIGLTTGEHLWIQVGDHRIAALFETGRETEGQISSVHYVRFRFNADAVDAFSNGSNVAGLTIHYGDYVHSASISPETKESLLGDLL